MNRSFCPLALIAIGLLISIPALGQVKKQPGVDRKARSTPAYSEILLRETELRADSEALSGDYTDDHPKVKESRYALEVLGKEKARLMSVTDPERLTLALGKIVVRKVDAEVELWRLQQGLADGHPDVKRARRRVEIFEAAIREILG